MKEYLKNIIPRIQRFSKKLDNLTILTNQHWVLFQEGSDDKIVYIFRPNEELIFSENGMVKKAKWEYVGDFSILIDFKDQAYLLKHGFFDEKILIMKRDGKSDFSIFLNESKIGFEIDSVKEIEQYLNENYLLNEKNSDKRKYASSYTKEKIWKKYSTKNGEIAVEIFPENRFPWDGDKVLINNKPAPDGKYKLGLFEYIIVNKGVITRKSLI